MILSNPFAPEFVQNELSFLDLPHTDHTFGSATLSWFTSKQPLEDYLNLPPTRASQHFPALSVEQTLWMSLTRMEAQSMWVPIQMVEGRVATAGLGLGYFALRAAAKAEVQQVDVYEKSADVVGLFLERFSRRPELKKMNFILGDARETLVGQSYDFLFVDIYETLLEDAVVDDLLWFTRNNRLGFYRFWGQERAKLELMLTYGVTPTLEALEEVFLRLWHGAGLRSLYWPVVEGELAARLKRIWPSPDFVDQRPMTPMSP